MHHRDLAGTFGGRCRLLVLVVLAASGCGGQELTKRFAAPGGKPGHRSSKIAGAPLQEAASASGVEAKDATKVYGWYLSPDTFHDARGLRNSLGDSTDWEVMKAAGWIGRPQWLQSNLGVAFKAFPTARQGCSRKVYHTWYNSPASAASSAVDTKSMATGGSGPIIAFDETYDGAALRETDAFICETQLPGTVPVRGYLVNLAGFGGGRGYFYTASSLPETLPANVVRYVHGLQYLVPESARLDLPEPVIVGYAFADERMEKPRLPDYGVFEVKGPAVGKLGTTMTFSVTVRNVGVSTFGRQKFDYYGPVRDFDQVFLQALTDGEEPGVIHYPCMYNCQQRAGDVEPSTLFDAKATVLKVKTKYSTIGAHKTCFNVEAAPSGAGLVHFIAESDYDNNELCLDVMIYASTPPKTAEQTVTQDGVETVAVGGGGAAAASTPAAPPAPAAGTIEMTVAEQSGESSVNARTALVYKVVVKNSGKAATGSLDLEVFKNFGDLAPTATSFDSVPSSERFLTKLASVPAGATRTFSVSTVYAGASGDVKKTWFSLTKAKKAQPIVQYGPVLMGIN